MSNFLNWGYSLHIGINDYTNSKMGSKTFKNLMHPINDSIGYMNSLNKFVNYRIHDYYSNIQLIDKDATLKNVLIQLIYLATIVEDGDVITITFSGHGIHNELKKNAWILYDTYLYDHELYQILRMINPKVRVNIISDCCHSFGMIDEFPTNSNYKENSRIIEKIKEVNPPFAKKLTEIVNYCKSGLSFCGVTHISATGTDDTSINDYISFYRFLEKYETEHSKISHSFPEFISVIRTIAFDFYSKSGALFSSIAYNIKDENLIRSYDPENPTDVEAMKRILPKMNQQGLFDPKHANKIAFRV